MITANVTSSSTAINGSSPPDMMLSCQSFSIKGCMFCLRSS